MSVSELYQRLVLDHNRAPRHVGTLLEPTHAAEGDNPLCGDHLRIELDEREGRIAAYRFRGESCAITTATASMLGGLVEGADRARVADLRRRFEALLDSPVGAPEDPALGPLNALAELRRYPARRRCALLPWATLDAALAGGARASTESGRTEDTP